MAAVLQPPSVKIRQRTVGTVFQALAIEITQCAVGTVFQPFPVKITDCAVTAVFQAFPIEIADSAVAGVLNPVAVQVTDGAMAAVLDPDAHKGFSSTENLMPIGCLLTGHGLSYLKESGNGIQPRQSRKASACSFSSIKGFFNSLQKKAVHRENS